MQKESMPRVDVLLAVYRPKPAYLEAQLRSLDAQDYPSMRILMLDDSADNDAHQAIRTAAETLLRRHPYRLLRNEKNLGVSATFQELTRRSEGELLAYCDQDDEWLPEKVSKLVALLQDPAHALSYSNQSIIDDAGRERYPTLQAMNPRFTHRSGPGLFPYFLQDNCVTGCTLMVRANLAKAALPFPAAYVHDQWLALCAASAGPIAYTPEPLIRYRLHGGNVIGMASLAGVTDRQSYVRARLRPQLAMLDAAAERFPAPEQQAEIARQRKALLGRLAYLEKRQIWRLPSLVHALWRDPLRLGLEALLGMFPQALGERLIAFAKKH